MSQIFRFSYRAQLAEEYNTDDSTFLAEVDSCKNRIEELMSQGEILSAGLFYAGKMLFLYYEAIGECAKVTEPALVGTPAGGALKDETAPLKAWEYGDQLENGEHLQSTCITPDNFMQDIAYALKTWPGQSCDRQWVFMNQVYYHAEPGTIDEWMKDRNPQMQRGRIAFLRSEKYASYMYYHIGLVKEGLVKGDKYHLISVHDNILFSYFEEPRTNVNLRNSDEPSKVLEEYFAAGEKEHFIHLPEMNGGNFMMIPALFTLLANK